jgi:hypothetical protein
MLDRIDGSLVVAFACVAGMSCGVSEPVATAPFGNGGDAAPPFAEAGLEAPPACAFGQIICEGDLAKTCDGQGGFSITKICKTAAQCKDGLGCVVCMPNSGACENDVATVCDSTGSAMVSFACGGPGMSCDPDGCHGACSPTVLGPGYIGCEFWPTVSANNAWSTQAEGFHFGVVLGNTSATATATISITGNGTVQNHQVLPGKVKAIALDWVASLKGPTWTTPDAPIGPTRSVLAAGSAYQIRSDVPLIAYQFNPLESRLDPSPIDCPALPGETICSSHSGDAALLFPAHVLSSNYVVSGYHAGKPDASGVKMGDFIAVTATRDDTDVELRLRPNQTVLAALYLPELVPGAPVHLKMNAGDVVELFTPGGSDVETLSGTLVTSTDRKPVQVLSGIGCASIPDDGPCSHMEEYVIPSSSLGNDYILTSLSVEQGAFRPYRLRIQATADGTALKFDPPIHNAVTINRGEVLEIPQVESSLRVSSAVAFAVTQYSFGWGAWATARGMTTYFGGPSQLAAVPVSQFRSSYVFAASPLHEGSFVEVIAPTGSIVMLDGEPVSADSFVAVGASGMSVGRQSLDPTAGVHSIRSDTPFGIVVYGHGSYASYAYCGGLDLRGTR